MLISTGKVMSEETIKYIFCMEMKHRSCMIWLCATQSDCIQGCNSVLQKLKQARTHLESVLFASAILFNVIVWFSSNYKRKL